VEYPVYRKMEFNSDRKRMSIIIRDPADNLIKMYTKGADSIIKSRLDHKQIDKNLLGETEDFLNKASLKGLRTLLMSMKVIDEDEYKVFCDEIAEAEKDVMNRDKMLAEIYDRFERGLVLLGGTAVEDRLQDNVPETINDL
jgi:magnesium-transporting ATPase (P-type)